MSPQLATLSEEVPTGEGWLHELKFDGYRLLCIIRDGDVRLMTRGGKDWSARFPGVLAAVKELSLHEAILDGEVVALDERGISRFQGLQQAFKTGREDTLVFYAFDLPYADGYDLRRAKLIDRKQQLRAVIEAAGAGNEGAIRFSDHVEGQGARVFAEACRNGLEGIVSKLKDSPYVERRTTTWLKSKCHARQEFVIGGMTRPKGTRIGFGALLLGYYRGDQFIYCGRVGTGFDSATLSRLERRLRQRTVRTPAFVNPPTREQNCTTWVRPDLVAEVEFTEWTEDGLLRHPVFRGLREDKLPRDVRRELNSHVGDSTA